MTSFFKSRLFSVVGGDFFFVLQIAAAFACFGQFLLMFKTTEGQLVSAFLCMEAYNLIQLRLAEDVYKRQPTRGMCQVIWTFRSFIIVHGLSILPFFIGESVAGYAITAFSVTSIVDESGLEGLLVLEKLRIIFLSPTPVWNRIDTVLVCLVGVGVLLIGFFMAHHRLCFCDCKVRGMLSVVCRGAPQLLMGIQIGWYGGAGVFWPLLLVGWLSRGTRTFQVICANPQGWSDKGLFWLTIGEVANFSTWCIPCIMWLAWKFF